MSRTSKSRAVEISAGLLVFRRVNALEVLLGHPGGPFSFKRRTHPQKPTTIAAKFVGAKLRSPVSSGVDHTRNWLGGVISRMKWVVER